MTKYKISGHIYFPEESQLGLGEGFSYRAQDGSLISFVNGEKNNCLDVTVEVKSEEKESAITRAENELERISNLISWLQDIPVVKWRINEVEFQDEKGNQNVILAFRMHLHLKVSTRLKLSKNNIEKLKKKFSFKYSSDFEEILIMWREALTEQSKGLKFFLFYRILEKLCDGKPGEERKRVEKWIKAKEKDIEMRESKGKLVTIYTFLRDNIHAKDSRFPYADIEKYLPRLQKLTKEKIREVFPREK